MPKPVSHFKYQPHVDGLRAVAILPVILFHAGLGFSGGYVGVDVFFVISGYLISGLILKDLENGKFHITEFWERRVRRILPALSVVVLASFFAGWFLFFPADFKSLAKSMVAQALLVSNFYFYDDASYFAQGVDMKPLLHTWSLAVEEQFYLLFPFLLLALRRLPRKATTWGIVALGAVSFLLSVYCSYKHPRANFYLLPGRAWELLTGAFLAATATAPEWRRGIREVAGFIGLAAIGIAVFLYNSDTRFPGATAALPCLGAGLIIWSNEHSPTAVGKLLASRVMIFIGLISYSLYLWHWPVLVFFKYWKVAQPDMVDRVSLLAISFVLAVLSWRFVETPFRKRVIFKTRSGVFAFGGAATATLLCLALLVANLQGVPSRIPGPALTCLAVSGGGDSGKPTSDREMNLADALSGNFDEIGQANKQQPVDLFVWGDSHARVVVPVLDMLCKEHGNRGLLATHPQTAPLAGYDSEGIWSLKGDSIAYNNAILDFIRQRHVRNVLLVARWDFYLDADKGAEKLHRGLLATIDALHNSGTTIWIMRQVPKYPWDVPKALASAVMRGRNPDELGLAAADYREQTRSQDPIFDGIAKDSPNVNLLDPTSLFLDASGRCRVAKDGKPLYYDSDHVNVAGAMMLRPMFEPIFVSDSKNRALAQAAEKP